MFKIYSIMAAAALVASALVVAPSLGQVSASTRHAVTQTTAAKGDAAEIARLIAAGEKVDTQDAHSRTPLIVAAHFGHRDGAQALLTAGANPNARDAQRYDIVTIAAVNNDVPMLKLALAGGC